MNTIAKLRELEARANAIDARIQSNGHAVGEVMHNGISLSSARWYYIQMLQKKAPALFAVAEAAKRCVEGQLPVDGAELDGLRTALTQLDEVEL